MSERGKRKYEHIENFMKLGTKSQDAFESFQLKHNALPEVNFKDIEFSTTFLNKEVKAPIIINAITGGIDQAYEINASLARIAKELGLPMAVGSQSIALTEKEGRESFRVVRDIMGPQGIVIGNLSANRPVEDVIEAVKMLEADAIQLHLNPAQEIIMPEGDRDFKGVLDNIQHITNQVQVPIIAKEVGNGISGEVAKRLVGRGVQYIDVGGKGGTNFIEIEDYRHPEPLYEEFYDWGIPTPLCIEDIRQHYKKEDLFLIASGGIGEASQIIKSLCLGAQMIGISGMVLRWLLDEGEERAKEELRLLIKKCKMYMLLMGKASLQQLDKSCFW